MGVSSATAAQAFKAAMVSAMQGLVAGADPEVLVTFGHPGARVKNYQDAVGFTTVDVTQAVATLGTNRAREETIDLTVQVSCWRTDTPDDETASAAAYALLGQLERHVRVTDTTLGGVVRHCFLVSHFSEGETNPDLLLAGRTIEIQAVFRAAVRITG